MSGSTVEDKLLEHRLDRAVRRVSDYWIPANPRLLSRVRKGVADGYYDSRLDELIDDIRTDLSLFSKCLGTLVQMMRVSGTEISTPFKPIELLRQAGIDQLKEILHLHDRDKTPHSLESGTDLQLSRMHEAIVSASAAEVLAENEAMDSEGCYAAAMLRQLGLTLVTWNYPALYQEAVLSLQPGDSLDVRLAEELGFSPSMLAIRVFARDGLPAYASQDLALTDELRVGELEYYSAVGQTVAGICRVGEALARAQHPESYPSARDDWEFARREVETRLGPQGMEQIFERIEDNLEHYVDFAPQIFRPGLILDYPDSIEESEVVGDYYNPYLSQCRERERAAIESLYRKLSSDVFSGKNVRLFLDEVLPQTEFQGGCVFTVDPTTMIFLPQLELGRMNLRDAGPVEYSVSASDSDIVSVAYRSTEPAVVYSSADNGELVSAVAGIVGASQRVGVLYLEVTGLISDVPVELVHFKALQHTLNDCLGLG